MKGEVDKVVDKYDNNLDDDTDSSFSPPALCFRVNLHQTYFFKNQNPRNDPPLQ